jgi:uncharacterized membrane protein
MWSNHSDWMGSMGGFMGLGWIVILIAIVAVVWLLTRGPLAGGAQTERRSALDILNERYARRDWPRGVRAEEARYPDVTMSHCPG